MRPPRSYHRTLSLIRNNRKVQFIAVILLIVTLAVIIGIACNFGKLAMWDSMRQLQRVERILHTYGLIKPYKPYHFYYATLWELLPGIVIYKIFPFLRDPLLVYHSLNFSLYPLTLFLTFILLRRAGVTKPTATLSVACLFGFIRLGGHSLFNTKDFPGAVAFLLVTLYTWTLLYECNLKGYTYRRIILCSCVSVIPFLVRVPLILPFLLVLTAFFFSAIFSSQITTLSQRIKIIAVSLAAGIIFMILLFPPFWSLNAEKWLAPTKDFISYFWQGHVNIFGTLYYSMEMPWWYAFVWIPIIVHPLVFVLCCIGFIVLFTPMLFPQHIGHPLFLTKKFNLSLTRWLWITLSLSIAALLLQRPTLYNEERHILFLYPLLFILGSLGLNFLHSKTRYVLAIVVTLISVFSYVQWHKYSYVYKSNLIINRHANQFDGDYWGLCFGNAIQILNDYVPEGYLVLSRAQELARILDSRLHNSLLYKEESFGHYSYAAMDANASQVPLPDAALAIIDHNFHNNPLRFLDAPKYKDRSPRLLWKEHMPLGDVSCALWLFDAKPK